MPTNSNTLAKGGILNDPRVRRVLRFTIGVTLATAYSSYINWPFSFMLVALTIALMALPAPAPSLRFAGWTVTKLIMFLWLGAAMMLPLHSNQFFGLALVGLMLFWIFYLQAEGKTTALTPIFLIIGITLVPAFGQSNMDVGVEFAKGMSQSTLALFPVIWIAFAILPGGTFPGLPKSPRIEGSTADRGLLALRPVVALLPLFVYMLSSENNIRYLIGYYQPAMIAQHASRARSKKLAIDLFMSTVIGACGGLLMWWLMKMWPSWLWFVILMALFTSVYASQIFSNDPGGLSPNYYRWSNGLSTLVFIVFPDALTMDFTGDDPNMKFYQRILDYAFVTTYSAIAVITFDAIVTFFRTRKNARDTRKAATAGQPDAATP